GGELLDGISLRGALVHASLPQDPATVDCTPWYQSAKARPHRPDKRQESPLLLAEQHHLMPSNSARSVKSAAPSREAILICHRWLLHRAALPMPVGHHLSERHFSKRVKAAAYFAKESM